MPALGLLENVKFDNTLGAVFVGFALSCTIYGFLCTQIYTYYRRYPVDRNIYKFIVAAIWILGTVDQCFIGHVIYYYTITNYLNPLVLIVDKPVWTLILQMSVGAIVGATVKIAFALRVWRFSSHNSLVTGIILLLTFSQFGLATLYTVKCFQLSSLLDFPSLKILASLALGAGVMTDATIAAALCYYLQKLRKGLLKSESDSIIQSLTLYAVNAGVLTSACSLITLITYDLLKQTFVFMPFYFVLSKLYSVSFLATLNTRTIVRGRGTDREDLTHTGNAFSMHRRSVVSRLQNNEESKDADEIYLKVNVKKEVSVVSEV